MDEDGSVSLFFGSSVTGMFSLLYCDSIRVNRYPGSTAKGLGQGNENSKAIEHVILQKYGQTPIKALVWMFGSIDVKFSYYFRLCRGDVVDPEAAMLGCAVRYMSFVRRMHEATRARTVVIGCEPNGAPAAKVYDQMLRYNIVWDTDRNRRTVEEAVKGMCPDSLRLMFNAALRHQCGVSGFDYVDIDEEILKEGVPGIVPHLSIVREEHGHLHAPQLGG